MGQDVRILTRSPTKAAALKGRGAEIVTGNFMNSMVLERALVGVDGVFAMTTFLECGIDMEVEQGKTLAQAAKNANVAHYVYTSVGGAERNTGIPHFETKWKVEQYIERLNLPATIFRPVFFMENFRTYFAPTAMGSLLCHFVQRLDCR